MPALKWTLNLLCGSQASGVAMLPAATRLLFALLPGGYVLVCTSSLYEIRPALRRPLAEKDGLYESLEDPGKQGETFHSAYVHNDQTFTEKYWNDPVSNSLTPVCHKIRLASASQCRPHPCKDATGLQYLVMLTVHRTARYEASVYCLRLQELHFQHVFRSAGLKFDHVLFAACASSKCTVEGTICLSSNSSGSCKAACSRAC